MATTKRNQKSIHKVETVSKNECTKQAAGEVLKGLPSKYSYLSQEQLKLLHTLHGWRVDIHHLSTAKMLRYIEQGQKLFNHNLVEIGSVIGDYGVHESHPYFSVKLGVDGLELINGKL